LISFFGLISKGSAFASGVKDDNVANVRPPYNKFLKKPIIWLFIGVLLINLAIF
jgi:hypothetical protein